MTDESVAKIQVFYNYRNNSHDYIGSTVLLAFNWWLSVHIIKFKRPLHYITRNSEQCWLFDCSTLCLSKTRGKNCTLYKNLSTWMWQKVLSSISLQKCQEIKTNQQISYSIILYNYIVHYSAINATLFRVFS